MRCNTSFFGNIPLKKPMKKPSKSPSKSHQKVAQKQCFCPLEGMNAPLFAQHGMRATTHTKVPDSAITNEPFAALLSDFTPLWLYLYPQFPETTMQKALMSVALTIAIHECNLNVSEYAGNQHNPRILAYHLATALKATTDEIPWCAAFVNWCLREAGIEGTFSAQARSFLKWGLTIPLESIEAGDVVVFARGNNSASGHVGFFLEWSERDAQERKNCMNIIGGNQSNRVNVATFSTQRLLSIRRML
jgi:uncharacterized protein (TIGR02594 family)